MTHKKFIFGKVPTSTSLYQPASNLRLYPLNVITSHISLRIPCVVSASTYYFFQLCWEMKNILKFFTIPVSKSFQTLEESQYCKKIQVNYFHYKQQRKSAEIFIKNVLKGF